MPLEKPIKTAHIVIRIDVGTPGEMLLEKILEEESNYGDERNQHPSPNENDKKYLLGNGHTDGVNITRI